MAVLDPNEIMFTAFEPKVQNRFIMYVDGGGSQTRPVLASFSEETSLALIYEELMRKATEPALNHPVTYNQLSDPDRLL